MQEDEVRSRSIMDVGHHIEAPWICRLPYDVRADLRKGAGMNRYSDDSHEVIRRSTIIFKVFDFGGI